MNENQQSHSDLESQTLSPLPAVGSAAPHHGSASPPSPVANLSPPTVTAPQSPVPVDPSGSLVAAVAPSQDSVPDPLAWLPVVSVSVVPLPSLGCFHRYPGDEVDLGSSVALARYQIPLTLRPGGEEHMEDGVIGCVLNFPDAVVLTRCRVAHIVGALWSKSSLDDDWDYEADVIGGTFQNGGTVKVGSGGAVYCRNLKPVEAPDGCIVAIPIGGKVICYDDIKQIDTSYPVYEEEL
ncbi:unnamed protein product [Eruca vesicaria subsp. sativa]|uniref:Uncharacterized protein n=1 Tax=Eruca vesicaria subsp. sativa TaxID=29727 RepID=A0ABC8MAC2_ERUVS|nr:unnamed protein product [Eruca vesicaria subsp. sativa]